MPWGCVATDIAGAEGRLIGTGKSNTAAIVAQPLMCSPPFYRAADICDDLLLNGYNDWFLPSIDELSEMYNKIGPGAAPPNDNIGGFLNTAYWSSTQLPVSAGTHDFALIFNFTFGSSIAANKDNNTAVRAIREF